MADSGIMREFLVLLGYKTDEAGQKKFEDSVDDATKATAKLDKATEKATKSTAGMAAAILSAGAMVGRGALDLAGKLEDLHFASIRTGAAASSLKAVEKAANDVGVSTGEVLGTIDEVSRRLRNDPAEEGLLHSLGVQTRDANGHLRDTVDIVNDLGKTLSTKPQMLSHQLAGMLGVNDDFAYAMRNQPQYFDNYSKYKADATKSGVDGDSGKAHGLMHWFRDQGSSLSATLGPVGMFGAEMAGKIGVGGAGMWLLKKSIKGMIRQALAGAGGEAAAGAAAAGAGAAEAGAGVAAGGAVAGGAAAAGGESALVAGAEAAAAVAGTTAAATVAGAVLAVIPKTLNKGEDEDMARRRASGMMTVTGADGVTRNVPVSDADKQALANDHHVAGDRDVSQPSWADSALGRLISRGEGSYGSVNLGQRGGYKASTVDLSNMTVADVMRAQASGQFNAAGRYQVVKDTLADAVKFLHLSGHEKFDKATQDRIFNSYLLGHKRRAIGDYLTGKSSDLRGALLAASKEWASVADPRTGKSYYAGKGNNHASISAQEMAEVFNSIRNNAVMPAGAAPGGPRQVVVDARSDVTINVGGSSDPKATAREVADAQAGVYQDATRNIKGAVT